MAAAKKPASLAERLAHARSLSNDLNVETDGLNAAFEKIQRKLAELRLGVDAYVEIASPDEVASGVWRTVTFKKTGSAWGLSVMWGHDGDDIVQEDIPLQKASKAVRLVAASKMEQLVEQLITNAANQVEEVRSARKTLDDLAHRIDVVILESKLPNEQPDASMVFVTPKQGQSPEVRTEVVGGMSVPPHLRGSK